MVLLSEIKEMIESTNVRALMLKQVPVLFHCNDKNVDFMCDPVDINCHVSSELENQRVNIHIDSDDVLNLPVVKSDLSSGQDTNISIVVDLSNAKIASEGDSVGLYIEVDSEGVVQSILLNTAQFNVQVNN